MSYQTHLDLLLKRAQAEQEAYETKRKAQADAAATQIDRLYADKISVAEKEYAASAAAAEEAYRADYDANAVAEAIARRRAAETIANYNTVNSGLNNTQQTAISLMRGNADVKTTLQKQAAVDSIMRELDALRAQYRGESANKQAQVHQDALDDMASYLARRQEAAYDDAYDLYKIDSETARASYDALKENGGGSRYATVNVKPSLVQIRSEAMNVRKKYGDARADQYLTQSLNRGELTPVQRTEIVKKMGLPEIVRPTEEEVRAEVTRLMNNKGSAQARDYVKALYDEGLIFVRLREKMYDLIDAS